MVAERRHNARCAWTHVQGIVTLGALVSVHRPSIKPYKRASWQVTLRHQTPHASLPVSDQEPRAFDQNTVV